MKTRKSVFVGIAILLAVFAFLVASDNRDQETANQLARQRDQIAPSVSPQGTSDRFQPGMFRLTAALTAEQEDVRGHWTIKNGVSSSYVELPFAPTTDGTLPSSETGDESNWTADMSSNPGFMGASACAECHRDRHDSFVDTAHHKTSGTVEPGKISGHFSEPGNTLKTSDPNLFFTMKQRGDRYFQEVSFGDWNLEFPLDVFTGSAKSGQSFLYWFRDALFQSHVSYVSEPGQWIASPGYDDTNIIYTRVIRTGCLECHITYVDTKPGPNLYHRDSVIWGISCERCHGPGRRHVEFHRQNPESKQAKFIVHPTDLPRQRQLDICGQCHSGSFSLIGDAFSFRPGDDLDDYHKLLDPDFKGVGSIHTSNQLTRLSLSKCFQTSEMTCTTCHDPHQDQRGNVAVFTKGCLSCHEPAHCGMSEKLGERIADNCVACHMPMGDNEGMTLRLSGGSFTVSMIDHFIRVDKKATGEYLSK